MNLFEKAFGCILMLFFLLSDTFPQTEDCSEQLLGNFVKLTEVVNSDYRYPDYFGDMPHTWVGAEYINSVRSLFVYETGDRLILAAGVPDSWLAKGVTVRNLQTWWGPISHTLKRDKNGQAILKLKCSQQPPNGFVVPTGVKLIIKNNSETTN